MARSSTERTGERRRAVRVAAAALARVVAPLAVGVLVYAARATPPRAFDALPRPWLAAVRARVAPAYATLPVFARGALPDAAWAFALASTLLLTTAGVAPRWRVAWIGAGGALAVGYELAQWPGWVPGTFDPVDLSLTAVAYACASSMTPPVLR
jgi:hypothetical protein